MSLVLGYRPDPFDARDFNAEEKLGAVVPPARASIIEYVENVLAQTNNDCVANAGFQAVRMSQIRQLWVDKNQPRPSVTLGSRRFGYFLSRATHHETKIDAGTFIRAFLQILNKFGFPPEEMWQYDQPFDRMPSTSAVRAAYDQRSPTIYRRISTTGATRIQDIKRAVAAGFPVVFGTDVSVDFASNKLEEPEKPPIGKDIAGGHAMTVVGYDGDTFSILNSWGEKFGTAGYCFLSSDYLTWDRTKDIWLVESAPPYSEP